jgi:hypothetical protein
LLVVDDWARDRQYRAAGTVEDVRQIIQDLLAPVLRAISVRLDAIDQKFASLRTEFNLRLETVAAKLAIIDGKVQRILDLMQLDKRLQKLEAQRSQPAA